MFLSTFAIGPFTLGIKGSINSSKITTDNLSYSDFGFFDFKYDTKSGYNIGAFARLGTKVYLQPELLYCVKNGETSFMSGNVSKSQTVKLKSIQIPILAGYKLIDLKLASIRAFTGPAMSYVMSGSRLETNLKFVDPKNFKKIIWDWQLGAGVDAGMITFDVRYEWGLSNVSDKYLNPGIGILGFPYKGNTLTFSIGFKFI